MATQDVAVPYNLDLQNCKIKNLAAPTDDNDAMRKTDGQGLTADTQNAGDLLISNGTTYQRMPIGAVGDYLSPSGGLTPQGAIWTPINGIMSVGHMYRATNLITPLTVTITTINTWAKVTGLTAGHLLNMSISNDNFVMGKSGHFVIEGTVTAAVPGFIRLVEWGIGLNGATPTAAHSFSGTESYANWTSVPLSTLINVSETDTVALYVRNMSGIQDISIGSLQMSVVKVSN